MRILLLALTLFAVAPAPATAQPVLREGISAGAFAAPALDTFIPWFIAGARVSVPAGGRMMLDLEGARIFSAVDEPYKIASRYVGQVRFLKTPDDPAGKSRYWLGGYHYMQQYDRPHHSLAFGYGARALKPRGVLLFLEGGVSLGDGFVPYLSAGVQWGRHRRIRATAGRD